MLGHNEIVFKEKHGQHNNYSAEASGPKRECAKIKKRNVKCMLSEREIAFWRN